MKSQPLPLNEQTILKGSFNTFIAWVLCILETLEDNDVIEFRKDQIGWWWRLSLSGGDAAALTNGSGCPSPRREEAPRLLGIYKTRTQSSLLQEA